MGTELFLACIIIYIHTYIYIYINHIHARTQAQAPTHIIHVKSPAFAGRLLEFHQISRSSGKENQSPGFSVKPKQFFVYVIFRTRHGLIGFYFRLTRVCFSGSTESCQYRSIWSIPVLIGRFLKHNHDVFLALGLGKHALYSFRLVVFSHVFCAPSFIKRLIRCLLDGNNSMAKCRSDSSCTSSVKKKNYAAKYKLEWATDLQFICHSDKGPTFAYCRVCNMHINVAHDGKSDLVCHASSASHSTLQKATSSPTATPTASVCS